MNHVTVGESRTRITVGDCYLLASGSRHYHEYVRVMGIASDGLIRFTVCFPFGTGDYGDHHYAPGPFAEHFIWDHFARQITEAEYRTAVEPASHSDQDIDNHNAAEERAARLGYPVETARALDNYVNAECDRLAQVVTPSGVQYLLPGESPPPAKKGDDTAQTRMF